jgi:hypothetical protein
LTLKDIRKENINFFTTSTSILTSPSAGEKSYKEFAIVEGVKITSAKKSKILLEEENENRIVLGFYSGHVILEKSEKSRVLIVQLPDLKLNITWGRCNIFCYDHMIRIISLDQPVEVEYQGKKQKIIPGAMFFLLNNEAILLEGK